MFWAGTAAFYHDVHLDDIRLVPNRFSDQLRGN